MAGPSFSTSSSRARSSSPFSHRRPLTSSYSSSSSSASSFMNGRVIPRSSPSSVSSHFYGSNGVPRSVTPNSSRSDSSRNRATIGFASADELAVDTGDAAISGESITVTVRFRPLSEREFQRGDEIAWYADGDKVVRCEYNPATAYAYAIPIVLGFVWPGVSPAVSGKRRRTGKQMAFGGVCSSSTAIRRKRPRSAPF
ncbi:hypothetical protein KSP39_PZI000755 [Platanthera zijinensis]|uniref:Kinesin motor domain-containing protein n=1 Tax=Platanthera zijinensis TaxID=2320716 RepID=A0AAP0C2G4_9ASPA